MIVIAEGIESVSMLNWLTDNHCDYMQGYFLSPPLSLSELKIINQPEHRCKDVNTESCYHFS